MNSVMIFHILGGGIALASGFLALFARKGSALHRRSGNLFVISMLVMCGSAAWAAAVQEIGISILNGLLTFYLVLTGWLAVVRKPGVTGKTEVMAMFGALLITWAHFRLGQQALTAVDGKLGGFPAGLYFFFAGLALFSALLDALTLLRRGARGPARILRHLWRMTTALLIASISLFLGQADLFPESMRHWLILLSPPLTVLLLLLYWIAKYGARQWRTRAARVKQTQLVNTHNCAETVQGQ